MLFIAIFPFTSQAFDNSTGFLDAVSQDSIRGWAWDSANPEQAIDVHIYIYEVGNPQPLTVIPVRASQYRSDLADAGMGDGKHGFSYIIDWNSLPKCTVYQIETYSITSAGNYRLENTHLYSSEYTIVSSLGSYKATAYCPCTRCTWGTGLTCTGAVPQANHTISVDTSKIPLGTKLLINGIIYTAEDRGGGIKGNHVDIYFNTHQEALNYGRKSVQVYIVE